MTEVTFVFKVLINLLDHLKKRSGLSVCKRQGLGEKQMARW